MVELITARVDDVETPEARFARDGFCVVRLPDPSPLARVRTRLLTLVAEETGTATTLETFHRHAPDDDTHLRVQRAATELLREERWHVDVIGANLAPFRALFGPDIDIQRAPYLRLARPQRRSDNVGFHRDTVYGGSPYEVSIFIPFVDVDAGATLNVEPRSHAKSEREIPFTRTESPDASVIKGSVKHQLGYPYAPQVLDARYEHALRPVPLAVGEVLVFSLALLHGSVVNTSSATRWSMDVRMKGAFSPVGVRGAAEIYMPLSRGAITQAAEAYVRANAEDGSR